MTTTIHETENTQVAELVLAAQSGNREAFGQLFERFERHVFAVALRQVGNYTEAQELCQDVFVQALQKIGQLRQPERFGGWVRTIARRMAINRRTRRGPDVATEPEVLATACVETRTPLSAALQVEQGAQLRAGLQRLGQIDRETLVAFYVKGHSLLEMSDEFQAPLGTIKRRLHVARKRLAREVESLVAV